MWQFFAIAVPAILGFTFYVLRHFASPKTPLHVKLVVAYGWFASLSIIILVPADIWHTVCTASGEEGLTCGSRMGIIVMWSLTYWSAFFLTWAILPTLQGYEDAGDFTPAKRLKTSVKQNLILYVSLGVIGLIGFIILIATKKMASYRIKQLAIGASNAFGLITGALLLGFGLVEIPRSLWRHADLAQRQRWLSHKVAKLAEKLDAAHQELSTAIVITQATSTQMSRRDPLRPMMEVIDAMANEDPEFKPSGGQIGENDMDYDSDEAAMASLRRRLRNAQDTYSRYKTEYTSVVWQALEIEDTIKNVESGRAESRRFVSRLRPQRSGHLAYPLDVAEWVWRCVVQQQVVRAFAALLGVMSVAIIFAEATLLMPPSGPDLSLFSVLIQAAASGFQEELVQVFVCIPLAYMCICTYFSIFKLGMFSFYYLVPGHTDSVSLLMNCSMVSRYAAPMCYNFLSLIHLTDRDNQKLDTIFVERVGALLLPENFEHIYPLVMVLYSALILANVHNRAMDIFGSWRGFRFETDADVAGGGGGGGEAELAQGLNPTALIILRRERASLERGMAIGQNVVPLARHFAAQDELEAATPLTSVPGSNSSPPIPATQGSKTGPAFETSALGQSPAQVRRDAPRDMMTSLLAALRDPRGGTGARDTPSSKSLAGQSNLAPGAGSGHGDAITPPSTKDLIAAKYGVKSGRRESKVGVDLAEPRRVGSVPESLGLNLLDSRPPLLPGGAGRTGRHPSSAFVSDLPPLATDAQRRASEFEGLLPDTPWSSMKRSFLGFTTKVRGAGQRGTDNIPESLPGHGGHGRPRAAAARGGEKAAASSGPPPDLDKIFKGLKSSKEVGLPDEEGLDGHNYSLLKAGQKGGGGTNGGTFSNGGAFR